MLKATVKVQTKSRRSSHERQKEEHYFTTAVIVIFSHLSIMIKSFVNHNQSYTRRESSCMADCQRNGVKSFVKSAFCYGRHPVKTNSFVKIMKM